MALTVDEKRRIFEEEKLQKEMAGKSVLVSIILSFLIPGLGDLYCNILRKQILHLQEIVLKGIRQENNYYAKNDGILWSYLYELSDIFGHPGG